MDQFRRALPISREFRSLSSPESAQKAMIFKGGISDRKEGPDILQSPSVSLGPPSDEIEPQQLKSRFSCGFGSIRSAKQPARHRDNAVANQKLDDMK